MSTQRNDMIEFLKSTDNWYPDLEITCDDCTAKDECVFAFDPYNTNGDCLADK